MTTVLLVLAALVAIFLLRGMLNPQISYDVRVTINRDRDAVFAKLNDLQSTPEWIGGLKKIEPLDGTPGEAGFRAKYFFEENGRSTVFTENVLEVRGKDSITFKMDNGELSLYSTIRLDSLLAGRTEVSMRNTAQGIHFFMKMMLPWFKGTMKKRHEEDLARLKALLES